MILVIGCGYVGGTIADVLEEHNIKVVRIDPKLNDNKIKDYLIHNGVSPELARVLATDIYKMIKGDL